MAGKIDVVLLQAVKGLGLRNNVVSVSVAYAKNVLFAKGLAKMADSLAKNNLAQKKEHDKKQQEHVLEVRDTLVLYARAKEELIVKRKVTPSGKLYEQVHESDIKEALKQWSIALPLGIELEKKTWNEIGSFSIKATCGKQVQEIAFSIKESFT